MSSAWIWAPGAVTEMDFSAKYGHFGQIVLSDSKIGGNLYITHSTLGDVAAPNPKYALLDINNSEIGSSDIPGRRIYSGEGWSIRYSWKQFSYPR